jgi:hypothetical protein
MIRTNSPYCLRAAILLLAFAMACLPFLWGCSEMPFSAGSNDETVSRSEVPMPHGHKPDMATTLGLVEAINYTVNCLCINGVWFNTDADTEIQVDDCKPCSFTAIEVGDPAKVKHDRNPSGARSYYAREIEIEHEADDPEDPEEELMETEGIVETIDGGRLLVSGVWFWTDDATEMEIDDECLDETIITEDIVKIEHSTVVTDGFGYYAHKIEIERECAEEEEEEGDDLEVEAQ